jgi:P27 family predicted phage terminase small subunit
MTVSKPPNHLSSTAKALYSEVIAAYSLETPDLKLLQLACEALDSAEQARKAIAEHGLTFIDKHGAVRARPEVAIERAARVSYARLLRDLNIDPNAPIAGSQHGHVRASNSRTLKRYGN